MSDVYKLLAEKLDGLPNGFPATESGVELKILQKIFTPEEAEMALQIRPVPETVEVVAERIGKPVSEMQKILDNMVHKGQINSIKTAGQQVYMLVPFIVGIYEFQVNRIDKELAELVDEYMPSFGMTVASFKPSLLRVVPVNAQVKADLRVHRYEDMRRMIEEAKSFQLLECICRKHQALNGNPCKHTSETCLGFSNDEGTYDKYTKGRIISKDEALKAIAEFEEEGLVHCTYNIESGIYTHVCNCCSCCCPVLIGVREFQDVPGLLVKSNFVASIDHDTCEACGACADERCPMEAIAEEDGSYKVVADRCIGCGVCTTTCPTESITLILKPESEHDKPPANLIAWYEQRAANRGINFKLE